MREETHDRDLKTYARLGAAGPIASRLGSAIISLVQPHPGREREFNRWYEDDHMVVSAMACPWVFAGKRWVATKELRGLRTPTASAVATPVDDGCFLAAYWILDGRYEQFFAWVRALVVDRLMPVGRMSPPRRHVFTGDHSYRGGAYRDATGPRDVHALDYPFPGLVMQVIDSHEADQRNELVRWLLETHAPKVMAGSPAARCLAFAGYAPPKPKAGVDWYYRRLTLLWFLDEEPIRSWADLFASQEDAIEASGLGHMQLAAPFIPVLPGTDAYVDKL
jgi:hypothetical protein